MAQDFPFAYEGGLVTNVTSEFITISGENSYTYDIGDTNTHLFSQGESVERFDLLCSGVNVDDFYTNSGTMINLATTSEEPRLLININRTATFSPDSEITEMFKKIAIPAGIILKETTD